MTVLVNAEARSVRPIALNYVQFFLNHSVLRSQINISSYHYYFRKRGLSIKSYCVPIERHMLLRIQIFICFIHFVSKSMEGISVVGNSYRVRY